ncbi:hypothetical protein [Tumebacillus lipolyticus]|uniref:Permease n=1 Tax=Tumebacillus lipolyticus TaxID=1280370 RepID=A0ABW4ZXB8_9BACL
MGGFISFLISLMFFYFGVKNLKRGKKVSAVILLLLGLMFTGGWLPALIGMVFSLVFALAILAGGAYIVLKLMRKLKEDQPVCRHSGDVHTAGRVKVDDRFDDEWKDFLKKQRN